MFIGKCGCVAISLMALTGGAVFGQTEPPLPEAVAKLIEQLSATEFRVRQQASDELAELGAPALPALRKAATAKIELEVKRRIERVVSQIENALLKAEEKNWQDFDAPRRGIKDRVVKILANRPTLSDQQLTSAIYLLSTARTPNDDEIKRANKQLAEGDGRLVSALQLARSLVQSKEFKADVAGGNVRLLKAQKDLTTGENLAKMIQRLNGPEFVKLTEDLGASLNKSAKADEQLVDMAFLLTLSRYPKANETKSAIAHLKNAPQRNIAATDLFWAVMNTKEFLVAP
jgi:hypothetical protein